MVAPVDLVNLASDAIGARARCSSINPSDGSQLGDVGSLQYPIRIQSLLRAAYWNAARRQTRLTLFKAAKGTPENVDGSLPRPPAPWLYEYLLPSDYLRARFIPLLCEDAGLPTPIMTGASLAVPYFVGAQSIIPFAIAFDDDGKSPPSPLQRVLLTDWPKAQLVYTADVSQLPNLWDPELQQAGIATLASFFVNPLNRNAQLAAEQANMARDLIKGARVSDGNESPHSVDHLPDWIAIRGAGYAADAFCTGFVPMGWATMSFGDGSSV